MHEVLVPRAVRDTPYFLISYSHTEHNGQGRERDPDNWVIKFHKDLCRVVEELAVHPSGPVGILDRELWFENDWYTGLPEALATSRVLVPLYSPRYFHSEVCGKEWYAFASREAADGARVMHPPAIVPVMWVPMAPGAIPKAARTVPIECRDPGSYAERGLDGIMKLASYRDDYNKVVRGVAQRIIAAAERFPPGVWPVDLDSLPNPFSPSGAPQPGVARLLITVVAPDRGDVPRGHGEEYYGTAAWDWAPFRPATQQPIATYTANFARSLGYLPYICGLSEREEDLLDWPAAHPELLIIDPWAVLRPECHRLLARFNLASKPWVQVVIPWNPDDGGTAAAKSRLWSALESALGAKLEQARATSAVAVEGVPSIDAYGAVLPQVIPAVGQRYLSHAAAYPPACPVVERPTLRGPVPGPPDLLECADA